MVMWWCGLGVVPLCGPAFSALRSGSGSGRRRVCGWRIGASDGGAFAGGCEAAQDQLDDALSERLVDWSAGNQQPIEDGAAKYVERELEIKPATEIPAPYTMLQHSTQRRAASGEELV